MDGSLGTGVAARDKRPAEQQTKEKQAAGSRQAGRQTASVGQKGSKQKSRTRSEDGARYGFCPARPGRQGSQSESPPAFRRNMRRGSPGAGQNDPSAK